MSTLKANTIKPVAVSSDLEIQTNDTTRMTLSATDGRVILPTNSPGIQFGDGMIQQYAGGKIRQVVTRSYDHQTATTTSTSLVNTGIEATITPVSVNSCILIDAMVSTGGGDNNTIALGLRRGSTDIALGVTGNNRRQATAGAKQKDGNDISTSPVKYMDNPYSTSALTYRITYSCRSGYTAYINRTSDDSDNNSNIRTISTITLMEVATGA
jgi:hypothetical protein